MAIGRISGPMLFSNLERQGVDLAFQSNLLYLDVTNLRVGVINSSPQYAFDSSGNVKLSNIIIQGNTISSNTGKIDLGTTSNITISGGAQNYVLYTDGNGNLSWGEISQLDSIFGNILLTNNTISIQNLDGNLVLEANGNGSVTTGNDFYVSGNLYAANFSGNLSGNGAAFVGNVSAEWFNGNVLATIISVDTQNVINGNASSYFIFDLNSTNGNISTLVAGNLSTGNLLATGGTINNIDLQANNFSTGNALILGGDISNVNAQINNLSSANILLSGGQVYNVDLQANNFSTANALINGGSIYNVDLQANNFSTGNALINGGDISNVNAQINNFSTANALVTGGVIYNVDIQANNLSTSNILVSGGYLYNISNITSATGNVQSWYASELNVTTGNIQTLVATNLSSGNLVATGGFISLSNANITTANLGNVKIEDVTVSSITGDLILSPLLSNSNAVVIINGTSALQLPSGTTGQQPSAYAGAIRWNSSNNSIEVYTGSAWISLLSQVNNQTISPDGASYTYTLDYSTTAEGIIVSVNGTLQAPGTAYTVTGNQITFSEIPLITDIISVRFIASGTVTAENAQEINAANITLTTSPVLIDSFNKNVYRSAKYLASTTGSTGSEFAEFLITQFASNVSVSNVNKSVTTSSLISVTANISGDLVQIYSTSSESAVMRLQKTYFIV